MIRVGLGGLAIWILCISHASAAAPLASTSVGSDQMTVVYAADHVRTVSLSNSLSAGRSDSAELPASRRLDSAPAPVAPRPEPECTWPNPTLVLVKSMVVPGWGQITNRRYFKAAIAIGLESWFIAGAVTEWRRANEARDDFRADPGDINHFYEYDFHNGNKNDYLWGLGVTVFISMFDAYVDAHLRPYQNDRIPDTNPPPGVAVVLLSF